MSNLTVTLDLPRDLLGALDVSESEIEETVRELIALRLYTDSRISSGKAAELLGITKLDFIRLLACHDIPYFTQSPEEFASEVSAVDDMLEGTNP